MIRGGVAAALGAYVFWGLVPIYFKLLAAVTPLEIIAHRIVWSVLVLAVFLVWRDGFSFWQRMRLPPRTVALLFLTGSLVVCNWLIYVFAVVNGQILSASLGYFITPLVNFLLGFLFLHERLSRVQLTGVAIAAAGTAYLGWFLGATPWLALGLAFTFGSYGLLRKKLPVGPMAGLLWETLLVSPLALAYFAFASQQGALQFGGSDLRLDVLLALVGLVTVLPLLSFNVAVRKLSLTAIGFFQYISPSLSFLLSVLVYGELFTRGHAVAFTCIWFALVLVSVEQVSLARRMRRVKAAKESGRMELVLVHGLWFGTWSMALLARRLKRAGFAVRRFGYSSTRGGLAEHARKLGDFVRNARGPSLHFVAHSLGGLVTLKMLADHPDLPDGRVLLLGSPLRGSVAARKVGARVLLGRLVGKVRGDLVAGYAALPNGRATGMIAGSRSLGLGQLVGGTNGPGDGTVALQETVVEGLADHVVLPVTHTGMLYSRKVAAQAEYFLRSGCFEGSERQVP